jgi:hypothetical protein
MESSYDSCPTKSASRQGQGYQEIADCLWLEDGKRLAYKAGDSMAGYWDIFPKNDFCRTNHFCLINKAANQFYKAIFN